MVVETLVGLTFANVNLDILEMVKIVLLQNVQATQVWLAVTGKPRTSLRPVSVTRISKAGIVSKELQEPECLLHVHLQAGVTLMYLAG